MMRPPAVDGHRSMWTKPRPRSADRCLTPCSIRALPTRGHSRWEAARIQAMGPGHLLGRFIVTSTVLATIATAAADAPYIRSRPDGLLDVDSASAGAIVRYTIDGSDPGRDAGVWLSPVNLPPGYTLK